MLAIWLARAVSPVCDSTILRLASARASTPPAAAMSLPWIHTTMIDARTAPTSVMMPRMMPLTLRTLRRSSRLTRRLISVAGLKAGRP